MQTQADLSVHFWGKTTLSQRFNAAHYLSFVEPQREIFVSTKTNIPLWFKKNFPQKTSTIEAYQILELLPTLRPGLLMELLTQCKSIKVKRLFLYPASKTKHD